MSNPIAVEVRGPIMVITIDRPEKRNAINREAATGLLAALRRLDADAELTVGVVTGAGGGFSAGMDLNDFRRHGTPQDLIEILGMRSRKPLIAAVEGFAVAGGFELALRCDLLVAAAGARLGLPEAKVGQLAWYGISRLQRVIPRQAAAELALTGDLIDAERAFDLGLVTRLVEPGQALQTAVSLAGQISHNAPLSLSATMTLLDSAQRQSDLAYAADAMSLASAVSSSGDALEGARAFTEHRTPVWAGR